MNNIFKALVFAADKHKNQKRKNKDQTPYINHPIDVANKLLESGVTQETVIMAALLHDTIEDTNTTYEELVNIFGLNVANIVKECTDDKSLPKLERKKQQILHVKQMSTEAKLVKLADKLSNLSDLEIDPPTNWTKEYIRGYYIWNYVIYSELINIHESDLLLVIKLNKIFSNKEITKMTQEQINKELQDYYSLL